MRILLFIISVLLLCTTWVRALENAVFPMRYVSISQADGEGTHRGNFAADLCGCDEGIDDFFAPFTLRIKRIQLGYNIVWAQSTERVRYADGSIDYMTLMVEHADDISTLSVGDVIAQGQAFYREGSAGNATGNHVHVEFGRGKFSGEGCHRDDYGRVAIDGGLAINEALFLPEEAVVLDARGYDFTPCPTRTPEIPEPEFAENIRLLCNPRLALVSDFWLTVETEASKINHSSGR